MPIVVQGVPKVKVMVKVTAIELRNLLMSLPDNEMTFVVSSPSSGQRKIYNIRRNVAGNLEYECDATPIP